MFFKCKTLNIKLSAIWDRADPKLRAVRDKAEHCPDCAESKAERCSGQADPKLSIALSWTALSQLYCKYVRHKIPMIQNTATIQHFTSINVPRTIIISMFICQRCKHNKKINGPPKCYRITIKKCSVALCAVQDSV